MIWVNKEIHSWHFSLLCAPNSKADQVRLLLMNLWQKAAASGSPRLPKFVPPQADSHLPFMWCVDPPPSPPGPDLLSRPSCISHIRLPPKATRACPCRTCPSKQSKLDCKETKTNVMNRMCACLLSVLGSGLRLTFSQCIPSLLRQA